MPLRELNQHTSAVIDAVARGACVVITRNGRPVARLVPVSSTAHGLDQLVATGRATAPTLGGPIPAAPPCADDALDLAGALSADRDEAVVAYDERLLRSAAFAGLPVVSPGIVGIDSE